jgi:hypothetical protein
VSNSDTGKEITLGELIEIFASEFEDAGYSKEEALEKATGIITEMISYDREI